MARNPNPSRIAAATWRLWEESAAAIGDVQLGGIFAAKPGYHNTRAANGGGDYSVTRSADKRGPSNKAAAVDITYPEAHSGDYRRIKRDTKRLMDAAKAKDPRAYRDGVPVYREVIGNVGGAAKAYDLYSRSESHRDDSHLWHIHISLTRKFVDDWDVLKGIVSILGGKVRDLIGLRKGDSGQEVRALQSCLEHAGFKTKVDGEYGAKTAAQLLACRKSMGSDADSGDMVTGYAYQQLHRAMIKASLEDHTHAA